MALTSSSFFIFERPSTPSFFATPIRCSLVALASTPPAVLPPLRALAPFFSACLSEGPFLSFFSQWSPTFSKLCLRAENAVRCARSPSPYSFTAESWALLQVRCAFFGERSRVEGSSSFAGISCLLTSFSFLYRRLPRGAGRDTAASGARPEPVVEDARADRDPRSFVTTPEESWESSPGSRPEPQRHPVGWSPSCHLWSSCSFGAAARFANPDPLAAEFGVASGTTQTSEDPDHVPPRRSLPQPAA